MSVVVAIKTDKGFMLGADRQITRGHVKNKAHKIFTLQDCPNTIVGGVGWMKDLQGISFSERLIPEIYILKNNVDTKLMYETVYDNIITYLKNHDRLDDTENLESWFIIAYKDKAWVIEPNGYVVEVEDYYVIGSGEEVAWGSLDSTIGKPPKERIKIAIESTSNHIISVDNDIDILTTY